MKPIASIVLLAAMTTPSVAFGDDNDVAAQQAAATAIRAEAKKERARPATTSAPAFVLTEGLALMAGGLIGIAIPKLSGESSSAYTYRGAISEAAGFVVGGLSTLTGLVWGAASPSHFELHPSQGLIAAGTTAAAVGLVTFTESAFVCSGCSGTAPGLISGVALLGVGVTSIIGGAIWAHNAGSDPQPVNQASVRLTPFGVAGRF
jgi:hypothetical protein